MSGEDAGVRLEALTAEGEAERTISITEAADQAVPAATPEAVTAATGGSLRDRLQAVQATLQGDSTKEFEVPGTGGALVIRAHLMDKQRQQAWTDSGASDLAFIVASTDAVILVGPDGSREEIPGGWGGGALAEGVLGISASTPATQVVSKVLRDVTVRIARFANQIVDWNAGQSSELERLLGE